MITYNITIESGTDYALDLVYTNDNGAIVNLTDWTLQAQLRQYPEAHDFTPFACTAGKTGMRITMDHLDTSQIGYTHGTWDAFLTTPDGSCRFPLIGGEADIMPRSAYYE